MRSTVRTTVSRDPAIVALLDAQPHYPGASSVLDEADRAWLRSRGVDVPDRAPEVPLHELARRARKQRQTKASEKKSKRPKKLP